MKSSNTSRVQGEGDYASAKRYNEKARAYAQSGKAEQAARDAAPRNAQEKEAMRKAEAEGRSRAKGRANAGQGSGPHPERPKPEKKAPGKYPEGYNPTPEKLPGR